MPVDSIGAMAWQASTRWLWSSSLVVLGAGPVLGQAQWSQFRGPGGLGVAPDDQTLPAKLDKAENLTWSCEIPPGHSSPCIWGDRIFITGATDREVQTLCIDRNSGKVLWSRSAMTDMFEGRHSINSSATPSPTTDGEHVFVYFGSCGLICYDLDGKECWLRRMRIPENMYGTAASPILAGGRLVFLRDNATGSFLEVIEPATGETIWRKEREGFTASWSTPLIWNNGGVDEIVCYGVGWVTAYALEDGDERWSLPGLTDEPCITPITGDGLVYITSYNMRTNPEVIGLPDYAVLLEQYDEDGDGSLSYEEARPNASILSRFDADGEGDHPLPGFFRFLDRDRDGQVTSEEWGRMYEFLNQFQFANGLLAIRPGNEDRDTQIVWQHRRGVPECPSPLLYGGRLFMVKNGGILSCLDAKTGALHFQERLDAGGPYYASPVAGDGKVYMASARGVVTTLEAGKELKVLSSTDLEERIMASPALLGGTVFIRTETHMYAFHVNS